MVCVFLEFVSLMLFIFMCMGVVPTHMHHAVYGGQIRELDPLEPELQMVASHCLLAESQTWFLWKGSQHS